MGTYRKRLGLDIYLFLGSSISDVEFKIVQVENTLTKQGKICLLFSIHYLFKNFRKQSNFFLSFVFLFAYTYLGLSQHLGAIKLCPQAATSRCCGSP